MHVNKASIVLFLLLSTGVNALELNANCNSNCRTSYGELLGVTPSGVKAYSNCNGQCISFSSNKIDEKFTGIKWQCVEFARRWLMINKRLSFKGIDIAANIWTDINVYQDEFDDAIELATYENGSEVWPRKGDLIIYDKKLFGTGHVAVVIEVDSNNSVVYVAEQNYKNNKWKGLYSRKISYELIGNKFYIKDKLLLGWKQIVNK